MFLKIPIFPLLLALFLSVFYCASTVLDTFENIDFDVFDWQSKQLSPTLAADSDIVIIAIDDYSLGAMNNIAGRWVWPRSVHAQLIESFNETHLSVVVFDLLFAERDIYNPDADRYFNEVLNDSSNVYFASLQQNMSQAGGVLLSELPVELAINKTVAAAENARASFILPQAIEQKHWQTGTINFMPSADGVGRFYDVYRDIHGWQIKSLAANVVASLSLPLPEQQNILLQWRGNTQQPFQTLSYVDVYQAVLNNDAAYLSQLKNKIVIIGTTASGLFDARSTPINHHIPGVYMLAMAIDNLKSQRFLTEFNSLLHWFIGCVCIFAIACCFIFFNRYSTQVLVAVVVFILTTVLLILTSRYFLLHQQVLFIGTTLLFSVFSFLLYSLSYGYIEYQQRQKTVAMFNRFLDPKIVESLFKKGALSPEKLNKKQVVTVLFSDIRNFTSISEKKDAQEVVDLLNQYFNQQVAIIFNNNGTLDKFIGDCIMAFWGAPLESKTHAIDAINTALLMEQELIAFQQTLPPELEHFNIGIGIHTGEVLVGMIGSDLRLDYTIIGDTVNLASRIEGLTKDSARILVSEQTMQLAEHAFDFVYQGEYAIKGRDAKVHLYQPSLRKI